MERRRDCGGGDGRREAQSHPLEEAEPDDLENRRRWIEGEKLGEEGAGGGEVGDESGEVGRRGRREEEVAERRRRRAAESDEERFLEGGLHISALL